MGVTQGDASEEKVEDIKNENDLSSEQAESEKPVNCFDIPGEGEGCSPWHCTTKKLLIFSTISVSIFVAVFAAIAITTHLMHKQHYHGKTVDTERAEMYQHGAVATDSALCSKIGSKILRENGSAVDSAIALSFCLGVVNMHSSGIGGGGFMLIYNRENRTIEALDYREVAPQKARPKMYEDSENKTKFGGLAIGVPGEVKGLYTAWQLHGNKPWADLVQPAIDLANEMKLQMRLHETIHEYALYVEQDPGLRKLLMNDNNEPVELGSIITNKELAKTLEIIRDDPNDFYNGELAQNVVNDMKEIGGLITLDDLASYRVKFREILTHEVKGLLMHTMGAPTGGPILTMILNVIKGYNFRKEDLSHTKREALTYHRIVEAFKFAYAQKTKEADPDFMDPEFMTELLNNMTSETYGEDVRRRINDYLTYNITHYGIDEDIPVDKGTIFASVLAPNGDAVAFSSTLNEWFGAMYRSPSTGIIYNNEMDDFSTSPTGRSGLSPNKNNRVHGGKRPLSSIAPVIMTNPSGGTKFIVGGSGGMRIISAVANVIINKLYFNFDLGEAIIRPRVYHQLVPNWIVQEAARDIPKDVQKELEQRGHMIWYTDISEYSAVQAIYVDHEGKIYAKSDPRKYGHTDGF